MNEFNIVCGEGSGEDLNNNLDGFNIKLANPIQGANRSIKLDAGVIFDTWFNLFRGKISYKLKDTWTTKFIPDDLYTAVSLVKTINDVLPPEIISHINFTNEKETITCHIKKPAVVKFSESLATLLNINEEYSQGFKTNLTLPKFLYICANNLVESTIVNNQALPLLAIIPIDNIGTFTNASLPKKIIADQIQNIGIFFSNELNQPMYFLKRSIMLHFHLIKTI